MMQKLRVYLWWKSQLSQRKEDGKSPFHLPSGTKGANGDGSSLNEALQRKDREKAERNKGRRRVRGGAPASEGRPEQAASSTSKAKEKDDDPLAELYPCLHFVILILNR